MGLHLWGWPPCDSEWGGRWSQRQGPGCDPLGLESVILFRSWLSPQCLWHWRLQAAPPDGHLTLCRKQKSLFSPAIGIFSLFGASFLCPLHLSQDGQAPVGDLTPPPAHSESHCGSRCPPSHRMGMRGRRPFLWYRRWCSWGPVCPLTKSRPRLWH